jgi:tetratricopeptide (TPR) repeat protein
VAEAIDAGSRATASDPGRAEYWRRLALAYVAASRWRDAIAAFERALSLAPYDVHNIGDLIAAKAASGDQSQRASLPGLAEQMVTIDPNNPYAQLTKATVLQFVGQNHDAVEAVERALELDPGSTNIQLYVTAAQIFLAAARGQDAERVAREGIGVIDRTEITLRAAPIRFEHARALASLGRVPEALTELDLIIALQPTNTAAVQLRTQLLAGR